MAQPTRIQHLTDAECQAITDDPNIARARALADLLADLLLALHETGLSAVAVHAYPEENDPAISLIAYQGSSMRMAGAGDIGRLARRLDAEVTIGVRVEPDRVIWNLHTRRKLTLAIHATPADPAARHWTCDGCGWFAAGTDLAAALAAAHADQTGHLVHTLNRPENR